MIRMLKSRPCSCCAALLVSMLCAVLCWPQLGLTLAGGPAFVFPIVRPRISSTYGMRRHPIFRVRRHHRGVDLVAPIGTPIRAISAGKVVFADPYAGYGNLVVIRHGTDVTSHYGHLREIRVIIGQSVAAGEIIGTLGVTGSTTGPHLHLEIRQNGNPLDPMKIIPALQAKAEG